MYVLRLPQGLVIKRVARRKRCRWSSGRSSGGTLGRLQSMHPEVLAEREVGYGKREIYACESMKARPRIAESPKRKTFQG